MQKKRKYYISSVLCVAVAFVVLLLLSVRTSPLYSLKWGDYGENAAATGMLMGKYWLQGSVPYKDLFAVGSPMYFLLQTAGWAMGGRIGIWILQILNYGIFLFLIRKILLRFCSAKAGNILCLLSLVFYVSMCSAGDSPTEWTLALTAAVFLLTFQTRESVNQNHIRMLVTGILCGAIFMIEPWSGGITYGLILFLIVAGFRKNGWKEGIRSLLCLLVGAAIVVVPFVGYFGAQGCLDSMIHAMFVYPFQAMMAEVRFAEVLHKCVKCVLALPLLGAGISALCKKEKDIGWPMVLGAAVQIILWMLSENIWHYYLVSIPGILIALAFFLSLNRKKIRTLLTAGIVVVMAGICVSPLKNYIFYLYDGVPDVVDEFLGDLQSFQDKKEQCRMLFLDSDCSWYLMADLKPEYRYFTDQTDLASCDEEIAQELKSYLALDHDVIISTEHGWTGQDIENYALIQVYLKKRGNICIYVPVEE